MTQKKLLDIRGMPGDGTISIPYGPWILWGQEQVGYVNANPMPNDRGDISYEAWVRLSRSPFAIRSIVNVNDVNEFTNGESNILLPVGQDVALGVNDGGPQFELGADAARKVTHLHFPHVTAPNIDSALLGVESLANTAIWYLTFTTNQPLFNAGVFIKSNDGHEMRLSGRGAVPDIHLTSVHDVYVRNPLRPYVSQYVEGVRSSSSFYGFLCFFKINARMNDVVRSKLRKIFEKVGLPAPFINGIIPEEPIEYISQEMVGMKYTAAIEKYQGLYRNSIAHFDPRDNMEPLMDIRREGELRTASNIMRWIAYDLIDQTGKAVVALRDAGYDVSSLVL